jgi:hypothetical protein
MNFRRFSLNSVTSWLIMNMAHSSNNRWLSLMMNMAHSFANHWLLNMKMMTWLNMMMAGLSVHDATDPSANARSPGLLVMMMRGFCPDNYLWESLLMMMMRGLCPDNCLYASLFVMMMRGFCPDNCLYASLFVMMMRGFCPGYLDSAASSRRHACGMMDIKMMDIRNMSIMMMFLYGMMDGLSMHRLVTLNMTPFMPRLQSFNMNLWFQFLTAVRDQAFSNLSNNPWVFSYNFMMMLSLAVDNLTLDVALVPVPRWACSMIVMMGPSSFNINLLMMIVMPNRVHIFFVDHNLMAPLQEVTNLSIRRNIIQQLATRRSLAFINYQTVVQNIAKEPIDRSVFLPEMVQMLVQIFTGNSSIFFIVDILHT